jgi:hypothetical protein
MRREPADLESAAAQLGEALTVATELGMRPEIARCRVSLGRLHRRIGKVRMASEHLTAGAALFRELGPLSGPSVRKPRLARPLKAWRGSQGFFPGYRAKGDSTSGAGCSASS